MPRNLNVVQVRGIKELLAALRDVEGNLPKEMRVVFNAAAKHVADRARPSIPQRSGALARTIKPFSTQRTGRVAYGTYNAVPYQGFIEFGGRVGRNKSVVRPFVKEGRYLFPAAEQERSAVVDTMEEGIGELIRKAGLG